jgi:DNA invertase Pin-like site-specific DNA recombinase
MNTINKRTIVGYVRLSTYIQAEYGHSIKTQKDAIRDRCSILGEELTVFYNDEEALLTDDMPAYTYLIDQIQSGNIQKVYVFSIERLGRNIEESIYFIELCKKHKTTVVALADSFDSDVPTTYLTLHIMKAMNERLK